MGVIYRYAVIVLCAMGGYTAYQFICWKKLTPSDWGTWFGAVATFLAFCGTIWLATSQERQRREKDRDIAHLVAARISGELEILIDRTSALDAVLAFSEDIFGPWGSLPDASFPAHDSSLCNIELLSRLTPLPQRASHRIARAIGLLQATSEEIVKIKNSPAVRHYSESRQKDILRDWGSKVSQARDLLIVARDQCIKAADIGAPHPSSEEVHGPQPSENPEDD